MIKLIKSQQRLHFILIQNSFVKYSPRDLACKKLHHFHADTVQGLWLAFIRIAWMQFHRSPALARKGEGFLAHVLLLLYPASYDKPRRGGSVVSVSDSCSAGCEFETWLRRTFFPAYFCLSPLQKHVRKVVGGFGKKFVLVLV